MLSDESDELGKTEAIANVGEKINDYMQPETINNNKADYTSCTHQ